MLDNVTKVLGGRLILDRLSLRVPAGERFGLLGRLGAGKSTVIRILASLEVPDQGTVTVNDIPVNQQPKLARTLVGYSPATVNLYPRMSVEEYLTFFAGIHGIDRKRRRPLARELLEVVGLSQRARDDTDRMSAADQRRLSVARSLVHDPAVLLYDEPTAPPDDELREELTTLLQELKHMGKSVLVTGRRPVDIDGLCDSIGVLRAGQMCLTGPIDEVRHAAENALESSLSELSLVGREAGI